MKIRWLHQQSGQDCLLFFAGWGMCPEPFLEIPRGEMDVPDVLTVYDYRRMDFEENEKSTADLAEIRRKSYRNLHLLAWSMGVWAASALFARNALPISELASAIAIGGTCHPVHDQLGIPAQNFNDMAEQLSPVRMKAFQRSMFTDEQEADRFAASFRKGERALEDLQQELLALAAACTKTPAVPDIYTSRIVTGRDRIFPARNQVRAWGRRKCRILSLPHFPFYHWPSWSAMLQELA